MRRRNFVLLGLAWNLSLAGTGMDVVWLGVGIGIERTAMTFGHERLDVYRAAIEWVHSRRATR
jgi:hypothetical protein